MLAPFLYLAPTTLRQASELLLEHGPRARVLAGGTALLVALERAQLSADALVNLKPIPELRRIAFDPAHGLTIGALTSLAELRQSQAVQMHYPVLCETIDYMATPQVRNLATVGGNLCAGLPAADLVVTFLALDAQVTVRHLDDERVVPLDTFLPLWGGPPLAPGEIVVSIQIPPPRGRSRYHRFMLREAVDVPLANLAMTMLVEDGTVTDARVVLGANGPRPVRMVRAERALRHESVSAIEPPQVAALVAADAYTADDVRASRAYRRELINVLTCRMLTALLAPN